MPELSRRRRLAVLAISCLSLLMIGLDDTIVSIALPTIARDFRTSISGLQWIADGYTLVLASLLIFGGATGDRFGRRRVFRVGLAVFTAASALCSLAPDLGWLIAFRVLQAVGGCMLNPVAVSIISGVFPNKADRARAIAVWVSMFGLGMALGPTLGGVLIAAVGWRGIFWVNVPVGLCGIALTTMFVPESRASGARRPDWVAQGLVIVILGALVYAIIEGAYTDWRAAAIRGFFIAACVALAVLVTWELRRKEPLINLRHFRDRSFIAAVLIGVSAFADLGGFLFLTTLYLQDVRGSSVIQAGLQLLPTAAAMAICPSLAAWAAGTTGSPRLPLLIGGLTLMLSTYLMAQFSGSTGETRLLVTFGLFGVGMGLVNSQISVAAVAGMPASQAGLASGIASASRQVGQALGVAVSGSLLTAKAHGRMHSGFTQASPFAWHLLFWCASAVVISGLLTTRARARHAMVRAPRRWRLPAQDVSAHPQSPAPPLPRRTPPSPGDSVWVPRRLIDREAAGDPAPESAFPRDPVDS